MAVRAGHGRGKGRPHVEVLPVDELPAGVPAPPRPAPSRDASGRFVKSAGTTALAREGGKARAESEKLSRLLGLSDVHDDHAYAPYAKLARQWRDEHMRDLAASVGGGHIGAGVASIVSSAALQLAASRWLADRGAETGSAKMLLDASRLSDASRQNLLAAHELAAKEAKAREEREAFTEDWP